MRTKILYVFCGELASGAEIVMESLILNNLQQVDAHLFISPGKYAEKLISLQKPYPVNIVPELKKLNRSSTGKVAYLLKAIKNYFSISIKSIAYIKKYEIEVVHANTVVPAAYLIPAVMFLKIFKPKVKWIWSDHDLKYFKTDEFFSNLSYKLYDKTITVSNAVKVKYGTKPKVKVLYNVMDTDLFVPDIQLRTEFRKQWEIAENTILFTIAGIISPRKGQLELMEAFIEAQKQFKNIRLFIAGNFGPDFLEYNQQVKELAAQSDCVRYIGHIDNMVRFYNGCDVIINNSSANGSEPFGATIYEAMSCEKIVMASNTGGLPELIDAELNGILFEPDNHESLLNSIQRVAGNFHNLEDIRKAARQKVINTFSVKIISGKYNELIERLFTDK